MNAVAWTTVAVTFVATPLLAHLASRVGWVDGRAGDQADRKPRRTPVPLVGGAALLLGLLAGSVVGEMVLPWPALFAAFGLGLWDDLRPKGISPTLKFAGQVAVAALLATDPSLAAESWDPWLMGFMALVAMNAANTFDCVDGACSTLGVVGLLGRGPAALGLAGFLPWNVLLRRGPERVPRAYLGDSGSHLVGVLLAAHPQAWPILALPLLDLARLSVVRLRIGSRPWRADRRHLGHRLERAGLTPLVVAMVLGVMLLPARWSATPFAGLGITTALFLAALWWTREVDPHGQGSQGEA